MLKLEIQNADVMRTAIQEEIHRSQESRYEHRLHGVLLVYSGLSCYDTAHHFARVNLRFTVK